MTEMQGSHDLAWLNELAAEEARTELLKCCGATRWAEAIEHGRPYDSLEQLIAKAKDVLHQILTLVTEIESESHGFAYIDRRVASIAGQQLLYFIH